MSNTPESIGRFKIRSILAQTPSHQIHLGWDPKTGAQVTISTPAKGVDARLARESIQREWDVSHALSHPGIQHVLEQGLDPDMGPFIVKEYIEGVKLSELLRQPLPKTAALHLIVQLMHALQAAANAGIIHGDIKPDNVLVEATGRTVLMDFHVSAMKGNPGSGLNYVSPGYASPETIQGQAATHLSDLFSFAVTSMQVLTGALPFQGRSSAAILEATCSQAPMLPPELSPESQLTFQKALEKDPSRRFQSLHAFTSAIVAATPLPEAQLETLLDFVEGKPTPIQDLPLIAQSATTSSSAKVAPCDTRPISASTPARRSKWPAVAAIGAILVLGLGAWKLRPHAPQPAPNANPTTDQASLTTSPKAGEPKAWTLRLITEPSGAEIQLDGKVVGSTPMESLELPRGAEHQLAFHHEGYQDQTLTVSEQAPIPECIRLEAVSTPPPQASTSRAAAHPSANRPAPRAAEKPASKAPEKKSKEFNLYDHLRKQEGGS